MRYWRNLILVAVMAALCFGGSFVCVASSHDDDHHHHP
jgi:hypothetical protein